MPRKTSILAPEWWDFTTLEDDLLDEAARLTAQDIEGMSRPGFKVVFYETLEEFYLAEALEYITAWTQSTADNPVGVCGPIGPTEHLPLVARLVNALELDLKHAHFWGMDEWVVNGKEASVDHALSFEKADRALCFDRMGAEWRLPEPNLHFPKADTQPYIDSWHGVRCAVMLVLARSRISKTIKILQRLNMLFFDISFSSYVNHFGIASSFLSSQ